jgi:hypothetical protein
MTVAPVVLRQPGAGSENAVDILEPVPRLLRDLGTSTCGLSAREAARRLERAGADAGAGWGVDEAFRALRRRSENPEGPASALDLHRRAAGSGTAGSTGQDES